MDEAVEQYQQYRSAIAVAADSSLLEVFLAHDFVVLSLRWQPGSSVKER